MTIYNPIPRGGYKQQPRRMPQSLGFARYGLSFDGVNDYVEVPDSASLGITGAITLEARLRLSDGHDGAQAREEIFYKGGAYALNFVGSQVNGQLLMQIWQGGLHRNVLGTQTSWIANQRYQVAGVFTGTAAKVYIDAVDDTASDATLDQGIDISTNVLGIGKVINRNFLKAIVDEMRIYNRALSEAELRWNMFNYHNPVRGGLVLWFPMEEGAGETVYDKSGYGNNGLLLPAGAGPTWQRLRQWELRAAVE